MHDTDPLCLLPFLTPIIRLFLEMVAGSLSILQNVHDRPAVLIAPSRSVTGGWAAPPLGAFGSVIFFGMGTFCPALETNWAFRERAGEFLG